MFEELDRVLKQTGLTKSTGSSTFGTLVRNHYLTKECLNEIPGDNLDDKALFIYHYVQEDGNLKPKQKKPLRLLIADGSSSSLDVAFLNKKYEVSVVNLKYIKSASDIDLILFTGGEDVNPGLYGEETGMYTHTNQGRDAKEMSVFNKFKRLVPMLGICRGNQLLTVLNGGRLIQHVSGHGQDHTIALNETGRVYNMTSTHHQMVYPFDMRKDSYEIIAHSEYFRSTTYLDGDNKEKSLYEDFLEPEIVFYKKFRSLCIQGHPEYNHCDPKTTNLCLNLIEKYLMSEQNADKQQTTPYQNQW